MKAAFILMSLILSSMATGNPGTMTTDDTNASKAEASLSGYRTTGFEEVREKEKQEERETSTEEESEDCLQNPSRERRGKKCD